MWSGDRILSKEFYHLLYNNNEFCMELGQFVLAAGRLEAEIQDYLDTKTEKKNNKLTMGQLIKELEKSIDDPQLISVLKELAEQRNYITHNLYRLFFGYINETVLPCNDLVDTDIVCYIDRIFQLNENLNGLSDIILKLKTDLKK